jgi:hypothetical protein
MKKLVNVEEVEGEGLVGLLGERVMVWCMNYIYTGTLKGVNAEDILLEDASVVYETGPLKSASKDAQELPAPLYIRTSAIESYYKAA